MKLLAFTLGMIVIPIGSYFVTVDTVFNGKQSNPAHRPSPTTKAPKTDHVCPYVPGNSTYAGALAAIMANVVLVGYIFVAMAEDQSDQLEGGGAPKDGKKDR